MEHRKFKILFQKPLVPANVSFGKFSSGAGNNTFPSGIASIGTYMKQRGWEVSYLEPNIAGMSQKEYVEHLKRGGFDVVGIGSTTLQIDYAISTFKIIKTHFPEIITVLGGVHATLLPRESIAQNEVVDYLVAGEGEKPFCRLMECLAAGNHENQLGKIKGLCFRNDGEIIFNAPDYSEYLAPEEIPAPLFDIFPMKKYVAQITFAKFFPSYTVIASRGCPYSCAFCNANEVMGRKVRFKTIEGILAEIRLLKEKYGAKGIMFLDSNFTVNKAWLSEFCRAYINSKLRLPWSCNSRADNVDKELLILMKEAGCWEIAYGIESANQKSLDLICKETKVEQNTRAIQQALELGYFIHANYILCLPGETEADVLNTINYAVRQGSQFALFYLPVPYPKTRLWDICKSMGVLRTDAKWSDYNQWDFDNPVYVNPLIGKEKMWELYKQAYIRFYSNPVVILRNLKEIIFIKQSPYKYWLGLKSFAGFIFKNRRY